MEYKDYYKVMGLERDADQDAIKRAYRRLARKYHPDVSKEPDAEERFKDLQEAYEVLKDPEKRAAYDRLGSGWQPGQEFRPPPGWETHFDFSGGGFTPGGGGGFSDFFEALFGGARPHFDAGLRGGPWSAGTRGFALRGEDQHARVRIGLDEAYAGTTRRIALTRHTLGGDGRPQPSEHTLEVRIPAGVQDGQRIRLAGQGSPGMGGASPGDLYLQVEIAPHALFRPQGRDIYLDLPVAPWEAALGAQVDVPTLGGRVALKVPPGAQSGTRLRLKGRGLPGRGGSGPGDQYVVLRIVTPPARGEADAELYRRMARELAFDPRAHMGD